MAKTTRAQRRASQRLSTQEPSSRSDASIAAFSFGEPEMVEPRTLLRYAQVYDNGRWYEPPVSQHGLADMFSISPHHSSALYVKRNLLMASFVPTKYLSMETFAGLAMDYVTFGHCYAEKRNNLARGLLSLAHTPALHTRVGSKSDQCYFVPDDGQEYAFDEGAVLQIRDADVRQEIYGIPEYLSAIHAAQLNRSATMFRRKYYDNGSHAGFILYMTDPAQSQSDVDAMRKALKDSKGPGNFRNLFMYSPNGKKDGIQLIPISEVAAKDDFSSIKNISRDDLLAAHRVPPQMLGIIPVNAGGFGDVEKTTRIYIQNEILPLQRRFLALNDRLGVEAVQFNPPAPL